MRVFLDANILFSAALGPRTKAHGLMELAPTRRCELLTLTYAIEEARRNLARKTPRALDSLRPLLATVTVAEPPSSGLLAWAEAEGLPPKDAPILAGAVAARADLLVTGDRRHFGHLFGRELRGVTVAALDTALGRVLAMSAVPAADAQGGPP